jgi:hypothetical protein
MEKESEKQLITKQYGWHLLAIEAAKFCNTSFFDIMATPATEVAGIGVLMFYKGILNTLN